MNPPASPWRPPDEHCLENGPFLPRHARNDSLDAIAMNPPASPWRPPDEHCLENGPFLPRHDPPHADEEDGQGLEEATAAAELVAAVEALLLGLGEDPCRVGLAKTPLRVARAFRSATRGYHQLVHDIVGDALFPESGVEAGYGCGGGFGGLVVVRNIDLFSMCEACLLPFKVRCHVGYISAGCQVLGLSKLSRVADVFARRLQTPRKLAEEITQGLAESIMPLGVAVALQCVHLPVPGLYSNENMAWLSSADEIPGPAFEAIAGRGCFDDLRSDAWNEFLTMLGLEDICFDSFNNTRSNESTKKAWCPCVSLQKNACGLSRESPPNVISNGVHENCIPRSPAVSTESGGNQSSMFAAAETILNAIMVDMSNDVLLTPKHFVEWLLNFKKRSQEPEFETERLDKNRKYAALNGHTPPLKADIEMDRSSRDFVVGVPFCSLCEHHLLPFYGRAHVSCLEADEKVDKQAISAIVEDLSQRLQIQERLTRQIAERIICVFNIQNVAVLLEAKHICMVSRGIKQLGSITTTVAVYGCFATDINAKVAFLKEVGGRHRSC